MNTEIALNLCLKPIGKVVQMPGKAVIDVFEEYRAALLQLEHFSHVIVLWWADKHDTLESRTILQTNPPYASEQTTGIFATRAEYRPNPIGLSVCKITNRKLQNGALAVAKIDALDGTPVLDLKAYFPVCDRVRQVSIPDWLSGWPDWMPEDGIGLDVYE